MEKQKYLYLALCLLGLSQSIFGEPVIASGEPEKSFVVGEDNTVKGVESFAFGVKNEVAERYDFAFGMKNIVRGGAAFGERNKVDGSYAAAFGILNTAKGKWGAAFGIENKVENGGIAFGHNNTSEAAASYAFGYGNETKGEFSVAFGSGNITRDNKNSAFGVANQVTGWSSSVIGSEYEVIGSGSGAWGIGERKYDIFTKEREYFYQNEGDASYMIGNKNNIAAGTSDNFILGNYVSIGEGIDNSVALGTGSTVSASNEVSVGSAGKERKITNVADGILSPTSTDAVNGSQLYEISRKIEGQGLDELKKDLKQDYKKIKNEMRGIGSLSAALAGLHPMQYDPYAPSQLMAAVGSYREKQAIAVGLSHYFTSHVMMSAGVALSDEKKTSTMANLGVTWKFGKGGSQASVENPQIMQNEMQRLARENQAFQAKIGSLESKVQELETALQNLLKR